MLVYANTLNLNPANGSAESILRAVDTWLIRKTHNALCASDRINKPMIRITDGGAELEVLLSRAPNNLDVFHGSVVFSHPDERVSGRKWFTRIGFRRDQAAGPSVCTVIVETSDISVQAGAAPVFATRPGVVSELAKQCGMAAPSPNHRVNDLTAANVRQLQAEIGDSSRGYAIVVVSPEPFSERLYVNPKWLVDQVSGLAKIYVIADKAETREISAVVGRRMSAWNGAINVIFPPLGNGFTPNHLISADKLKYETGRDKSPESYILYLLTHRLNLPNYRQEITPTSVRQHALNIRLRDLEARQQTEEQQREVSSVLREKLDQQEEEIARLKAANENYYSEWIAAEERAEEIPRLQAQIASYKAAFDNLKQQGRVQSNDVVPVTSVADAIETAKGKYSDSIIFALNGKSDGDESPFQPATEVLEAFDWLASVYRPAKLGQARCHNFDHNIRERIEGWFYSGHQSEITLGRFAEWYRCNLDGKTYDVTEHVGSGSSTRPEETIRVAFAWDRERKIVVVGFIGQHQKNTLS